ncbi:MAG: dUTP diphosphatase [Thioalkalivibrionaceae bacterium]
MLEHLQYRVLDPRIGREWPLPGPATQGSAGVDLRAMINARLTLAPGATERVSSGLAIHIADSGWCGLVLPRSGLASRQGIVLANLVGLIDSDYQGPLEIALWNRSSEPRVIEPGDRVAQLVFVPVAMPVWQAVPEFTLSERGEGGFGSTGTR